MFSVRIHGRGGQGAVTAAEMLSVAAFREGRHAQAFPTFGSERTGAPVVSFGHATVDLAQHRVTVRDGERENEIRLTPTEWHLLEVLVRYPGKLLSQRQLLAEVWGPGYETAGGNLRVYMAQLRRKLEPDPARPRFLLTEPGMGYRFQPEPVVL